MREQMWLIEARFKSVGGPWIPQAMEPFMESADAEAKVDQLRQRNTLSEWRTRRYRAEPSPEPEAAPASEAQAPAVPECNYSEQAERDAEKLAEGYYSPHRFGDGPAWYAACVAACRELAQLRARVAILDAQKVELPELDITEQEKFAAGLHSDTPSTAVARDRAALYCRERQLLDAQRAVQAWREVARKQNEAMKQMAQEADGEISVKTYESANSAASAYDALAGKEGE